MIVPKEREEKRKEKKRAWLFRYVEYCSNHFVLFYFAKADTYKRSIL